MKADDTNTIPEVISAPWLKRFFKAKFGIPVRVEKASSNGWVRIWIISDQTIKRTDQVKYSYKFPAELGQRCMAIVYRSSESLSKQSWGGNIGAYSIALLGRELRELLEGLIANPISQVTTSDI